MLTSLIELVFPLQCVGCGEMGRGLCAMCATTDAHQVSGLPVPGWAAGEYDGALRAALLRYKERGRRDLLPVLAGCLASAVARLDVPANAVLIPVPSSAASLRARGYDHLTPLARRAARQLACRRVARTLVVAREVADSAGLGLVERNANLAGAMRAGAPRRPGQPAVVIDDIITTGASAREACRALQSAGWTPVGFASVAATPRADTQPTPLARIPKAV